MPAFVPLLGTAPPQVRDNGPSAGAAVDRRRGAPGRRLRPESCMDRPGRGRAEVVPPRPRGTGEVPTPRPPGTPKAHVISGFALRGNSGEALLRAWPPAPHGTRIAEGPAAGRRRRPAGSRPAPDVAAGPRQYGRKQPLQPGNGRAKAAAAGERAGCPRRDAVSAAGGHGKGRGGPPSVAVPQRSRVHHGRQAAAANARRPLRAATMSAAAPAASRTLPRPTAGWGQPGAAACRRGQPETAGSAGMTRAVAMAASPRRGRSGPGRRWWSRSRSPGRRQGLAQGLLGLGAARCRAWAGCR